MSQARPVADLADFIYDSGAHVHWRHFPAHALSAQRIPLARSSSSGRPSPVRGPRRARDALQAAAGAPRGAGGLRASLGSCRPGCRRKRCASLATERWAASGALSRTIALRRVAFRSSSIWVRSNTSHRPGRRGSCAGTAADSTEPRGTERDPIDIVLGYLEEAPLPLFVGVLQVSLPDWVADARAGLRARPPARAGDVGKSMGFIEAFPNEPVFAPGPSRVLAPSLMRRVDRSARRHVYDAVVSADELPGSAVVSAELGVLATTDGPGRIALWVDGAGHLYTERYSPAAPHPSAYRAVRWAAAPATWRDIGYLKERPRAIARRSWDVAATNAELRLRRARRSRDVDPGSSVTCTPHRAPVESSCSRQPIRCSTTSSSPTIGSRPPIWATSRLRASALSMRVRR